MDMRMTQQQLEAYLRSLPEGPEGDVVIDRNPDIQPEEQAVLQEQGAAIFMLQELIRKKDELEEELSDLELEEPMEVDFDSYEQYEIMYDEWNDQVLELEEQIRETEEQIATLQGKTL